MGLRGFKDLSVAGKIYLIAALAIPLLAILLSGFNHKASKSLRQARYDKVKQQVQVAASLVDSYVKKARQGQLSMDKAQKQAQQAVSQLRYADDNYFWINDSQPRMIMHPFKPQLNGQDLSSVKDPEGKRLFVAMAETCAADGSGFVRYLWPRPGADKAVPKISYVKQIPQWDWIIGSGLYIDDLEAELAGMRNTAIGLTGLAVLLTLVVSVLFSRSLSRPISRTVTMIEELEKGHLGDRLQLQRRDEIGRLAQSMDRFAQSLEEEITNPLLQMAQGDICVAVQPRDGQDQLRHALQKVGNDLNQLMQRIQQIGDQIHEGAGVVADISSQLSQGSTQQASSLEQINSSMQETASQVKDNAEHAQSAQTYSQQARQAAENGHGQMNEMVSAMEEINEAGQNISKIIKTIDEIAFQTNLLALNAAVEAARAGQHGKGFAVVAEEVRNLAARSAKAAQETTELIQNSVDKAQHGADLAHQVESSFNGIVDSITETANLVTQITQASQEQSRAIEQIQEGLSQIDQITQNTTASAEQCASSTQELSSQAQSLHEMLNHFRPCHGSNSPSGNRQQALPHQGR